MIPLSQTYGVLPVGVRSLRERKLPILYLTEKRFNILGETIWYERYYPIEAAEYEVNNDIVNKPAFNWWVNLVLKKQDSIISKVKICQQQYLKKYD